MKHTFGKNIGQTVTILLLALWLPAAIQAQTPFPFVIENTSPYSDGELYVAIVGETLTDPPQHIWIDCQTGAQLPMSPAYNTVAGPVYGGNMGPGGNALYANCFTKLTDIPDRTIMLPGIQGCRVFISKGEQLYFYFFGASGAPSGYTSPSHTNPTDPSQGILYEIIELTYDQYGFFGNTTRVDSYKAPIGMELYGNDGYYRKVGEIATHQEIVAAFAASVPTEFQGCLDAQTGEITAPSKTAAFADGSIGTMPVPGPYVDYMKPYVDAVWAKYANEDLVFDAGDAGIWKGRVQGEQLVLVSQSPAYLGRQAVVARRPTTQEVLEGKGVLDNVVQDGETDLLVQAQLCAALNRHVIDINTPNVGQQDWSDASAYYLEAPCNYYAKFWHRQGISVDGLSYGFAYDDVWSYSSSLHTPDPSKVVVNFGSYDPGDEDPDPGFSQMIEAESYTAMAGVEVEDCAEGGQNIGWIDTGDWMAYGSVTLPASGNYLVEYRVASLNGGGRLSLDLNAGSVVLGELEIPSTGAWQSWTTVSHTVYIEAGTYNPGIYAQAGGWNINWLKFTQLPSATAAAAQTQNVSAETAWTNEPAAYPNPAEDIIYLKFNGTEASAVITNRFGRPVIQLPRVTPGTPINISALEPGIYILRTTTGNDIITQQIIKH